MTLSSSSSWPPQVDWAASYLLFTDRRHLDWLIARLVEAGIPFVFQVHESGTIWAIGVPVEHIAQVTSWYT